MSDQMFRVVVTPDGGREYYVEKPWLEISRIGHDFPGIAWGVTWANKDHLRIIVENGYAVYRVAGSDSGNMNYICELVESSFTSVDFDKLYAAVS